MNSNNFKEYISAYIDNELPEDEKKEFQDLMRLNTECKIMFDQTMTLLDNLKSIPKLETSSDFSAKLQQKIELSGTLGSGLIDKISSFFTSSKPSLNFALSFGAIAIFTFIYLNDLSVFQTGFNSAEVSKQILNKEEIEIELASGIDDEYNEIGDEGNYVSDFEGDSLDKQGEKLEFNLKGLIQDVIKEVNSNRTFNGEK